MDWGEWNYHDVAFQKRLSKKRGQRNVVQLCPNPIKWRHALEKIGSGTAEDVRKMEGIDTLSSV